MNRPAPHSRRIPYIVAGTALFALLAFLLSQTGYYSFCYLEQWDTFIYNSAYLSGSLALPGGCVQLLSSFLTQFFCRPLTGILITALLLTWIALLTADILHRWTKSKLTLPLALFPVAALFFLHCKLPIHRNHSLPVDAAFPPPAVLLPQVHRTVCLFSCKHLPALRNGRTGRLSVQLPHTDHRIVLSQEEGTLVHIPSANGVPDR